MTDIKTIGGQWLLSAACTALLCCMLIAVPAKAEPGNRNILFIAVDDLRSWVNYRSDYGGTVHTPNIDALAAVSTRYLNAYTSAPNCLASRTSAMMGMSPAVHGVGLGDSLWDYEAPPYTDIYDNPLLVSLPEVMSQNGYHSASSGKVFHKAIPDRWDENGPVTEPLDYYNQFDPGPDLTFLDAQVLPEGEEHPDQTVATWTANFITDYADDKPFFLAVGFYQPHLPWRVPQWAYDLYPLEDVVVHYPVAGDLDDEPALAVEDALSPILYGGISQHDTIHNAGKAATYTQAYLAAISHTDAMIGQVLSALAASPYKDNTDVILWSDHGYHLGEKGHWRKNVFWDPATKVPLLVNSPGNPNYPVADVREAVSLIELAPSVLDLAGIDPISQFAGVPLHDAVNRSPVEIFHRRGKATVSNGFKIIDYDTTQPPNIDDLAAYWLPYDRSERSNVIIPLIIAAIKAQARAM